MADTATTLNSMGFAKPAGQTRVVVAMSGGVDSSVTAAMLVEEGYEVIGITMQLYDHGVAMAAKGACCAGADIHDARQVAGRLDIPHYVLDYESLFQQQVMDDFADSYLAGHTPIPCVRCNQTVKFKDLLGMARDLGADCLATGHYVRRDMLEGQPVLRRGIDSDKDQSYFLFATTPEQLEFVRFPLGSLTKDETRALARKYQLSVSDKPDSQDICFVPNGRYGDVVRKLRPGAIEPGLIKHMDGRTLGTHKGVIDYTIGQRRGLGIGGRKCEGEDNAPLYVVAINAAQHEVIVGPQTALACHRVYLSDMNWVREGDGLLPADSREGRAVLVKLRNTAPATKARLFACSAVSAETNMGAETDADSNISAGDRGDAVYLQLETPEFGIATGQAGVIYDGEDESRMLGGGWISKAPTTADSLG
ncbi:MAG: tRNA 2-thiouridine(34) synthase MnmA [Candidatus Puniceispirillaceae bacterium]